MMVFTKLHFCNNITSNILFSIFTHSIEGSIKIVQMLLEKGAHVNALSENNNTALIIAAAEGNTV